MRILIPGPLRDYTANAASVSAAGLTLGSLLADLDRQFPGLRFRIVDEQGRIRRHIKFFVDGVQANDLNPPLNGANEVMIVCALSGG
jgi:sulfur-carrier protein